MFCVGAFFSESKECKAQWEGYLSGQKSGMCVCVRACNAVLLTYTFLMSQSQFPLSFLGHVMKANVNSIATYPFLGETCVTTLHFSVRACMTIDCYMFCQPSTSCN